MYKPIIQKTTVKDKAIIGAPDNQQSTARLAHVNRLAKDVADQLNNIKHYEVEINDANIYVDLTSERGILDFEYDESFDPTTVDLFHVHLATYTLTGDYTPVPDQYYVQTTVYSNGEVIPVVWVAGYAAAAHVKIKNLNTESNDWGNRFYLYYELIKIV